MRPAFPTASNAIVEYRLINEASVINTIDCTKPENIIGSAILRMVEYLQSKLIKQFAKLREFFSINKIFIWPYVC